MALFKKLIYSFYFLYFLVRSLLPIKSEMKIFPDHISSGDPLFNTSQVYSKTNERFIYKLGYYTDDEANKQNIFSKKYGIYYEPVSCVVGNYESSSPDFVGPNKVITNTESTIEKGANVFEEIELFQKVLKGNNIECPSHLKLVHNKNLVITYTIPVISSETKFTVDIKTPGGEESQICDVDLEADVLKIIQIDIKTDVDNSLGGNVTMVFTCTDSIKKVYIKGSGDNYFTFIYNKDVSNDISLSNFRITVEDLDVKTGLKSNKNLIRSKNGLPSPNSCNDRQNDEEGCFREHLCRISECKECHYSCAKCYEESSSSSCSICGPLTISENQEPTSGVCPINFVDLSQFRDINIDIYPKQNEFNERATIGLWVFFANLTESRSLENDIYHIVLENRIVISLVPGDNKLTAYCHAFEDLYRKVTSNTKLYSYYTDRNSEYVVSEVIPSSEQLGRLDIETMNGKWFHISCAISLEQKQIYIKSVVNGQNKIERRELAKEKLYPGSGLSDNGLNDYFFSHIINEGDHLTLSLKNFGSSNAKIYAKHLIFFKEFISENMQYMYFNFSEITNFQEILFQLPLDELIISPSFKIYGTQYDYASDSEDVEKSTIPITLELSHSDRADFKAPLNFYRLLLNQPNKKYSQIDLSQTTSLLPTSPNTRELYYYDDNKILKCAYNYSYTENYSPSPICDSECKNGYIIYPGVSKKTGYCNYKCDYCSMVEGEDFCRDYDSSQFYNLFSNCVKEEENIYLQFSGFYNSQLIKIDLEKPLPSYLIEFWFYPDFFLQAAARQTQFTFPTYEKNFFFHSNVMDCYFYQTDRKIPYLYDSKSTIRVESLYNSNEWNKFVIHGKYLSETDDYIKTVYVNHAFDQPFAFSSSKESATTNLSVITFCENKCQDITGHNIHWTTGYYRDLRIWDGDLASFSEVVQYNDFYNPYESTFTQRINSILCYFPLSKKYIANNKILDLDSSKHFCNVSLDSGTFNLKKYNYGAKFDIIGGNNLEKKYSQHGSDPAFIDSCDNGCSRCWERTYCYKCESNYFLSGRKCLPIQDFFYRSPKKSGGDIELDYDDIDKGVTISFWTKPIGFISETQNIMTIGSANNFQLFYSSKTDVSYGLYLLGNDNAVTDDKNKIIAKDPEFRDNIGKWTFISLAYHKEQKNSTNHIFFPRMMKFEINTDSIEVDISKVATDPNFSKININSGYFGLFSPIKFYTEFVIQAIAYENNNQAHIRSPFKSSPDLFPGELKLKCTASGDNCVPDEKPDLGLFIDTCPLYQDTLTTTDSCYNVCSGKGWEKCTCSAINYNSQMLFNNTNKTLCRPLDYINFAKMKIEDISGLKNAKERHKCTLQFWMFAYSYTPNGFNGITFDWVGHNKIELFECGGYKCKFVCSSKKDERGTLGDIPINKWMFLSCAIDYENGILYMNATTQEDEYYWESLNNIIQEEISNDPSTLKIADKSVNPEWGMLFFRQIRLWKNAFFNPEFLSRVFIETPSKFPDLLHSWEPVFNGKIVDDYKSANLKVYDIVDRTKIIEVKYADGTKLDTDYGRNVMDENAYSILTMCSEDGLYFDVTLKKCMQFLDLSKMKDFTFKDLPSSYSGNYAMAFWVFFEDAELYIEDKGLHINWSRHLQITIIEKDYLTGYCFPQGYYSDYVDNDSNFNDKFENAINKADIRLLPEGQSESGNWIWVICSVSYYMRDFYFMANAEKKEIQFNNETLSKENGETFNSSYPMRFFFSDLNNNNMYKSQLSITNINPAKKLYLREILLFRNYIPDWYSEKIKYMNLRDLSSNQLPSLAFVVNFADFDLETKKLKYYIYERGYGETIYEKVDTSLLLQVREAGSTFELSANFKFQTLCDLDTMNPTKYEEGTCVKINNCVLQDLKATFCMDENIPISCQTGSVLTIVEKDDEEKISCESTCKKEEFIIPGTPRERAICNTNCGISKKFTNDGDETKCPISATTMNCGNDYTRIGYQCIPNEKIEVSALFFSKCYNSPNFYRTISTNTINKLSSGYFYEFWIKFDNDLIQEKTCKEAGQDSKEYYLYSTPHSIYKDNDNDVFYYQIINSAYKKDLPKIHRVKWNKIVIETRIETTGQNVYVHMNFEKQTVDVLNIDTSIIMRLQYISFCSRKSSGDCIPGSSNIMWGSAFYRNIRVWDIKSSSIQTILDYNSGIYTDISKSLVLFYPLTIKTMDNNVIKEIISGEDNIIVKHLRSNNFQSDDDVINYNYETNLEWQFTYECPDIEGQEKKVLVFSECKKITGKYLKVPTNPPATVSFKINSLDSLNSFTFCIYMKFIGVLSTGTSAQPIIFSFRDDTFLVYDIATSYVIFYIGGYEKEAFRDTQFHDYIGIWIPICMANLISEDSYRHPNMFTLSINKIDIPFTSGFSLPKDGVKFARIAIGPEIIAYFSQFRVYPNFIQGNFGTLTSSVKDEEVEPDLYYSLKCSEDCIEDDIFIADAINKSCVGDYNIYEDYEDTRLQKNNDDYYLDINLQTENLFASCHEDCKTFCYKSKNVECTCNMTDTVYWLRKNKATSKTYCEHPPFIDYSLFDIVNITVPSSCTNESTLEFWFYIYSYNTTNINFKGIDIIWDKHNGVQIINQKNSLSAKCYAVWEETNEERKFTELVLSDSSITAFGWNKIRCGTEINKDHFQFFLNSLDGTMNENYINTFPYGRCDERETNLIIRNDRLTQRSYGFFFIRELKLWQQYNRFYIDSSYINLGLFGYYSPLLRYSEGSYPGLISLIRSEYDINLFEDAIEGKYHITNLIIPEDIPSNLHYKRENEISRANNEYIGLIGYNIIDPTNSDYYKTLLLCDEGWVYNSLFNYCEQPSYTKCKFPGDTKDTCMLCPEEAKYVDPVDGLCKSECPTGYYARDDINQCRPCHKTCYKCSWLFEFNCTECIGELYLYRDDHRCVAKCEEYNLTASNITDNLCTGFDSNAILINHKEYLEENIDLNTFDSLEAKIINYTSKDYTTLWGFETEMTLEVNNYTLELDPKQSPFIGDLTKEEKVLLNKTFFKHAKDYIFSITVTAHNILDYDSLVNNTHYFHLRMNSYPVNGSLNITPNVGLYRTTYFVIKCEGWGDDTSAKDKLQYRFFAKEIGTNNLMLLRDWSLENEISTNFSVMYYQQDKSDINITCEIKDELNATTTSQGTLITIAKSLSGGIYSLEAALQAYPQIPTELKSYEKYDVLLYHRSEFLLSVTCDPYKTVYPAFLQTQYEPTLQGDVILKEDPTGVSEYCNGNGEWVLVDEFIVCLCNEGWTGKYCHINETDIGRLEQLFDDLFYEINSNLQLSISWYEFMGIYNLFKGASLFFNDTKFFSNYIEIFMYEAMNNFDASIANNTQEYFDILDFYYSYEMMRMEKLKAKIQKEQKLGRKVNFTNEQMTEFKEVFKYLNDELLTFMRFLANQNAITRKSFTYNSENFYLAVIALNPSFDDKEFFKERKKIYKTYVEFMSCLNYIEIDKLSNQYYQGYLIYIEYNYFPFSYNHTLLENNISPLIELNILDSTTGKFIAISGCNNQNKIIIHMPFYSYRFLDEFNSQKLLYDPNVYKSPDDPIFSDPVYIEENGKISDDTIDQRIAKYSRRYNISPNYYDNNIEDFSLSGIEYINFTNDLNFIEFSSTHLCMFSNFMIKNNATYHPNGRFYYVLRPRIIKYFPNFYRSMGSLVFLGAFGLYACLLIIFLSYDSRLTEKEILLDSIKQEIIKNFYPYAKNIEIIYKRLVPSQVIIPNFKPEIKFGPEANINPTKRDLMTPTQGGEEIKAEKLTMKTNVNKGENEKNEGSEIKKSKKGKIRKNIINNFIDNKTDKKEKAQSEDNKSEGSFIGEVDKELGKVDRATFNTNYLSKDEDKTKEEKDRRIESYANLKLDACTYFRKNYVIRNILINAIGNVSLFQPRWKKLTMLFTEITIMILMISIFLTIDEKARIDLDITSIQFLLAYGLASCAISNFLMYLLAIFFEFPYNSARRLFKLVLFNGQLIVMREWGEINSVQRIKAFFGTIICVIIWLISLYISLGFTAVWKEQKFDFLISLVFGIAFNFFILELIVEGIIALVYKGRRKYNCLKQFGFLLNRLRNYRCLA